MVRSSWLGMLKDKAPQMPRLTLQDKIEHAAWLTQQGDPSVDAGAVLERAVAMLLASEEEEEKERLGDAPTEPSDLDESERCTFVREDGERCLAHVILGAIERELDLSALCAEHDDRQFDLTFDGDHVEWRLHDPSAPTE